MKPIEIHLHSFSLRYQFKYRNDFNVFSFIELADTAGFTGVNISANGPGYRDLGGTKEEHFDRVRQKLAAHKMNCEIDTSDTRLENLDRLLDVANAVGAGQLRVYTRYQGNLEDLIAWTVSDFRAIAPKAADLGINIVLENHEDFQGSAIADILEQVNHPRIRALYDYGNSQMVGEEPVEALEAMIDYISAVHVKDHVLLDHEGINIVQGVPIGQGLLPIMAQTEMLYQSGLRRFCFENVWGYTAPVIAGVVLPDTASFSKNHDHEYLNANQLAEAEALTGEMLAFDSGWRWFQDSLNRAGYTIQLLP